MFFGVNFILQKFCQCKKNDKYQVCVPPLKFYIECTTLLRALSFQLCAAFVISVFGGIILQNLEQNISSFTTAQILECLGTETQSELNLKRNAGLLCAANPK